MQILSNATVGQGLTLFSMIWSLQTLDDLHNWMNIENRHESQIYLVWVCMWG